MRIHHVINSYTLRAGGAERLVRRLHGGLRERGIDSFLLGLHAHPDDEVEHARSLKLPSPYSWKACRGVASYFRNECKRGDIVHAHLFPTMMYCSLLKRFGRCKGPLLATEHSTSNRRRGTWKGRLIDSVMYPKYDAMACISEGTRDELSRWSPRTGEKCHVIPNGVRLHFDKPIQHPSREVFRIVSVGRLTPAKNYENALRAVANLTDLPVRYEIAGGGSEEEKLRKCIADLKQEGRAQLLGQVEDVPALLREADLFLIPSSWEGFGIAAVEAMNASLPVIASDVPGLKEVVESDQPCAVLVDPSDPQSIAEAIRSLIESPEKRAQLGRNGFERARRFSEEAMIDRYLDLYTELSENAVGATSR